MDDCRMAKFVAADLHLQHFQVSSSLSHRKNLSTEFYLEYTLKIYVSKAFDFFLTRCTRCTYILKLERTPKTFEMAKCCCYFRKVSKWILGKTKCNMHGNYSPFSWCEFNLNIEHNAQLICTVNICTWKCTARSSYTVSRKCKNLKTENFSAIFINFFNFKM